MCPNLTCHHICQRDELAVLRLNVSIATPLAEADIHVFFIHFSAQNHVNQCNCKIVTYLNISKKHKYERN